MQASHRVGVVGRRVGREISGRARGHVWTRSNGFVVGSTARQGRRISRIAGRLAGCSREAAGSCFGGTSMRNGAHSGAPNACDRFTAGFAVLFGGCVALQARTAAAAVSVGADALFALLLLFGTPRLRRLRHPAVRYLGVGLPLVGFYFLYLQTGLVDPARIQWHDATLLRLQGHLLPRVPYVPWPPAREWFAFAYLSYEPILITGVAAIFSPGTLASQRRAGEAVRGSGYTRAFCLLSWLLYPALIPRYHSPEMPLSPPGGGVFSPLGIPAGWEALVCGTSF